VLPAAGTASRLGPLPCSKELLPVGYHQGTREKRPYRPKVVSHYLLERMRLANVSKVYVILRNGKWDIPAYFGDGNLVKLPIAYLMMALPFGVPFTLDQSYPFVKEAMVIFGFPDILFKPEDAFVHLLDRQAKSGSAIVLGLFPSREPQNEDLVKFGKDKCISKIVVKPRSSKLRHTWLIAVWTPTFTHFLHNYIADFKKTNNIDEKTVTNENFKEVFLGDVFNAALKADFQVDYINFTNGSYIDIGTPENWVKSVRKLSSSSSGM
jgi:glucose-1-phosphate thymidylyltransferase